MTSMLVTYDLKKPGQDYTDLLKAIKGFDSWAKLSESSYAIITGFSPESVFAKLKPYLDSNDHLYVITLRKPYSGYGPSDVNQWLEKHLS